MVAAFLAGLALVVVACDALGLSEWWNGVVCITIGPSLGGFFCLVLYLVAGHYGERLDKRTP